MPRLSKICLIVIIIGSLNMGLIGLFNFDLIGTIFNTLTPIISRIVYALIGVCGVVVIASKLNNDID